MEDVSSSVEALALAERLRRAVAAASTADGGAATRCSVGVALHDPADPRPLLERADRALYVAKTQGRDRCSLA
jgi:GGDEF domain-containing protein